VVPDIVVEAQKGQNSIESPLDGITAGLYQLMATYDGQSEAWPLVVVR
jgi:hypothetical protein